MVRTAAGGADGCAASPPTILDHQPFLEPLAEAPRERGAGGADVAGVVGAAVAADAAGGAAGGAGGGGGGGGGGGTAVVSAAGGEVPDGGGRLKELAATLFRGETCPSRISLPGGGVASDRVDALSLEGSARGLPPASSSSKGARRWASACRSWPSQSTV